MTKTHRFAVQIILMLLLAAPASGQFVFGDEDEPRSSAEAVAVTTHISTNLVTAGDDFRAAVVIDILEGWHINAHLPTFDYLIGTDLNIEPHADFLIADIRYPRPVRYAFDFAGGETLDVYEGRSVIYLDLRASPGAEPGHEALKGSLRVQACDDQICLAPSNVEISIPFDVVPAGTETEEINQNLFAGYDEAVITGGSDIADLIRRGWLIAFLSFFVIGLALNLTPCVYPMLSVTVSLFGAQTETAPTRIFLRAVIYVLGIATMYSLLGVAAALTGGLFGGLLQSPWVLAVIGVLLFALALSMFGLYEFQPPYWLTSRISGGQSAAGLVGLYLSGLVVGIFAAPCIGPPIIALLAFVGAQGDPLFGFASFFVLSLGLGAPYLVLGTSTGLLQKLPKSGEWMVWVKKVFGVILVGAALFYLSLALQPRLAEWVIPVTLIAGGIYLGFAERSGRGRKVFTGVKWGIGVIAVLAGIAVIFNLQREGIEWDAYHAERIEQAQEAGMPVVMDFYADWCIPCIELERRTFTDAEVRRLSESFVRLKVDLTHFNSPEAEELRRRYAIAGVPTVVFLDERGEEVPEARVVGFVPPSDFLSRMRKVVPG